MKPQNALSPAIFLDRDGTLHKDTGYMSRFEDFKVLPGVENALKIMQEKGYRLFVATNQSGIARGMFSVETVLQLHAKIQRYFKERGIALKEFVFCPHHPEGSVPEYAKECNCRKPKPGMLMDLASRHRIDLPRSYMVGDHRRDAEAGLAAGCIGVHINKYLPPQLLDNSGPLKEFASLIGFSLSLPGVQAIYAN